MNEKRVDPRGELPEGLYWRPDSPYIWGKFKVEGMAKPYSFSTETFDKKLAKDDYDAKRGDALRGKLKPRADKIGLKALVKRAVKLMRKNDAYLGSVMNVVDYLLGEKEEIPAKSVTPERIEEYDLWRSNRAALSTCNREIGYLQACYNVAREKMKLHLDDPVKGFARHDESLLARDRVLTYEERAKLFADPDLCQEMKDVYMFALKTGMRQGELRAMKWVDINWADKTVKVMTEKKKKRGASTKSKAFRHVPLFIYAFQILKKRRGQGWDKKSAFVFCTEDGQQLSRDGQIVTALEWACTRNKIENFRYHDFRHTFATDFLRANHDLKAYKTLSEILGHSMETITSKYAHLFPQDKMDQINLLPLEPAFQIASDAAKPSYVYATLPK